MPRFLYHGTLRLILILGLFTGSGWAGAQDDNERKKPFIKQPSLLDLAKLYQELDLPLLPKEARFVRIDSGSIGDRSPFQYFGFNFGIGYTKQEGAKKKLYFWNGLNEWENDPSSQEKLITFETPPKPEDILQILNIGRIRSAPMDFQENRPELILALHCHFLGNADLAQFFYWRCKKWSYESLDKTLVIAAWNHWVEKLANPKQDRAVIALKLKNIVDKYHFFEALGCLDKNHPDLNGYKSLLDQLDRILKEEKSKLGTVEALLRDMVDCPRRYPFRMPYSQQDPQWENALPWQKPKKFPRIQRDPMEEPFNEIVNKVYQMGFNAIPVLIEHVDDQRFTRGLYRMNFMIAGVPGRSYSIGDFGTLNQAVRSILGAYFDSFEGKGDWKKNDYLEAWKKIKDGDELELVFQHLERLKKESYGSFVPYILARYPEKIKEFYQRIITKNPDFPFVRQITQSLIEGKLPKEEKVQLLLQGTKSKNPRVIEYALLGLIELDPSAFDLSYLKIFETPPKVTDEEVSWGPVVDLIFLGLSSENPKVLALFRDIVKKLPNDAKIKILENMDYCEIFLNKSCFLLFTKETLNDRSEVDVKKVSGFSENFAYPGKKTIEVRNFAAYKFLLVTKMAFDLDSPVGPDEWSKVRSFVRDEIERQLELEGVK